MKYWMKYWLEIGMEFIRYVMWKMGKCKWRKKCNWRRKTEKNIAKNIPVLSGRLVLIGSTFLITLFTDYNPRKNLFTKEGNLTPRQKKPQMMLIKFSNLRNITTPNRELCVFQELSKIGFCDYQNVFSRNEEKLNFKVPPIWRKNSDFNISSAEVKFSRNEAKVLWILHNVNNIWFPCLIMGVKILRFSSILQSFLDSSEAFLKYRNFPSITNSIN